MTWETRVRSAIRALANGCASANVQWMLIGGIAVIARGAPRTTQDIDATVLAPGVNIDELLAAFRVHQDRQDIERLLLKHRATVDLARVRARVLEFAQLLEA